MVKAFTAPACRLHNNGEGHPERPERLDAAILALETRSISPTIVDPAEPDAALIAHTPNHIAHVRRSIETTGRLDADTAVSEESLVAALCGVEASRLAAAAALEGDLAVVIARPPGHHALADIVAGSSWTAMRPTSGFCVFNSAAISALSALELGADRVAVVDFDAHHGNGTQDIFWDRPNCAYLSCHQAPFYPGTGSANERGAHAQIVNAPVKAGTGDEQIIEIFDSAFIPFLNEFQPDLLVVSAGYDGHADDPLCWLEMTTGGFRQISSRLAGLAPTVIVLEGGYDLQAITEGLGATIDALS